MANDPYRPPPGPIGATITTPFALDRTPRAQIEAALASVAPFRCPKHPHELRPVDPEATVMATLRPGHDTLFPSGPARVDFSATYADENGKPLKPRPGWQDILPIGAPSNYLAECQPGPGWVYLEADHIPRHDFAAWLAGIEDDYRSHYGNRMPHLLASRMELPFPSWTIAPRFAPCLQCGLERLGIAPYYARASFDSFQVDQSAKQQLLDTCRAFAAAPASVLLLRGNVGTGKTHLAIAILRERLRQQAADLAFVKHRHFLEQHWLAQRPVTFGTEAPESPLARCQASSLLVYDDVTAQADNRSCENVLLDLIETRIGYCRPSIITTNLSSEELERALGTRLMDRLREVVITLDFGFESKRPALNPARPA